MSAPEDPKRGPEGEGPAGEEGPPDSNPMRSLLKKAMTPGEPEAAVEERPEGGDSDDLRDLLRRTAELPVPAPKADVLRGVQRRIRQRSAGKFYSDGWSTREEHPRGTYLITAAVMLLLVAIVYFALVPGGVGRP